MIYEKLVSPFEPLKVFNNFLRVGIVIIAGSMKIQCICGHMLRSWHHSLKLLCEAFQRQDLKFWYRNNLFQLTNLTMIFHHSCLITMDVKQSHAMKNDYLLTVFMQRVATLADITNFMSTSAQSWFRWCQEYLRRCNEYWDHIWHFSFFILRSHCANN